MSKRDMYPALCGKIREKFRTQGTFAKAIGMNPSTLSAKLAGKSQWSFDEVVTAAYALDIPIGEAMDYFSHIFLHKKLQDCSKEQKELL